jgi:large subunit ribosomal protein L9
LYGSITSQDVVDAIQKKSGYVVKRQQLDMQPLRTLGEHTVRIRLTMDLIPEIKVTVFREGEAEPSLPIEQPVEKPEEKMPVEAAPEEASPAPEA